MNAPTYNFAYLDEQTKRMIRRAILKAIAIPGYQVPFGSREMPLPYGWGTGGIQLTAALLEQETVSGDQVRALAQAASSAPLRTRTPASLPAGSLPAPAPATTGRS